MKIDILFAELNKLNFPKDQYAITSSGILAIRGIRKARYFGFGASKDLALGEHVTNFC